MDGVRKALLIVGLLNLLALGVLGCSGESTPSENAALTERIGPGPSALPGGSRALFGYGLVQQRGRARRRR